MMFCLLAAAQEGEATSENNALLKQALARYPAADANKDGILTMAEGRAYLAQQTGKGKAKAKGALDSSSGQAPTVADAQYGPDERNVLDFWRAKADQPTPVVVFIHGGGFVAGDKSKVRGDKLLTQCLENGVSFAAINYRYRTTTPIQDVLRDCGRAIQFIRSQAGAWNVDKSRIASYGGSAGAGSSLWLAFHDDLADPNSSDPVLRESSRLSCAGANACQFSYDVLAWEKLFGDAANRYQNNTDFPSFYGLKTEEELRGPVGQKLRADCDMVGLIDKNDPPVFVNTGNPGGEVTDRGHLLHHPKHAEAIKKRCDEVGIPAVAQIPGLGLKPSGEEPADLQAFLFKHLKVAAKQP